MADNPSSTNKEQSLPPGVLTALLPRRIRPVPTALAAFPGGIADISIAESNVLYNKYDLLCPRPECGSIIIHKGVAKLIQRPSVQMEPANRTPPHLLPMPEPPELTAWFLITPSPLEFENIGFSKPVDPLSGANSKQLKLLLCAQCDLGPLGWSEVDGTEFWLACSRVGYRVD